MKDEKLRFWVEDKVMTGNFFQRYFNLLAMIKDLWVCMNLLGLYTNTLAMMSLLSIFQLVFSVLASMYPPYKIGWQNTVMQITQWSYLALDLLFIMNETVKLTPEQRYFYVGFGMIACVLVTMVANVGIGTYQNMKATFLKCKKKREKANQVKQSTKDSVDDSKDEIQKSVAPAESSITYSKLTTEKEPTSALQSKTSSSKGVPTKIKSGLSKQQALYRGKQPPVTMKGKTAPGHQKSGEKPQKTPDSQEASL